MSSGMDNYAGTRRANDGMRIHIGLLYLVAAATLFSGLKAEAEDFTVSIVGQQQSNNSQYKSEGLPLVHCRRPGHGQTSNNVAHQLTLSSFFVVKEVLVTSKPTAVYLCP